MSPNVLSPPGLDGLSIVIGVALASSSHVESTRLLNWHSVGAGGAVTSGLGYDDTTAAYISAPKGFALLLAIETIVSIALIFSDFHLAGWIIGGVAGSVTAVSYRVHERAVRKRAGTKYVPSRTIGRLVAVLLLVAIAAGATHAGYLGSEVKLSSDRQGES